MRNLRYKPLKMGAEEMTQWLKVYGALAEDLCLIPRIHVG